VTVQVFNYLSDSNFSGTSVFTLLNMNLLNLNKIYLGKKLLIFVWCQIVMALKMKADGSFETFYLYTRLDGVTLHKNLCFILRIVFWIVVHRELLLDTLRIMEYAQCTVVRLTGVTESVIGFIYFSFSI
jgi:hypothetical protein